MPQHQPLTPKRNTIIFLCYFSLLLQDVHGQLVSNYIGKGLAEWSQISQSKLFSLLIANTVILSSLNLPSFIITFILPHRNCLLFNVCLKKKGSQSSLKFLELYSFQRPILQAFPNHMLNSMLLIIQHPLTMISLQVTTLKFTF